MFTSSAASFLMSFFNSVYQLFQMTIPGTTVSFFQLFIGLIVTVVVIGIAHQFTAFGISVSSKGFISTGGNNKKIKVPEERRKDTR